MLPPIIAYHCNFSTYGFWMPNDPRGSWSDYVRCYDLFIAAGEATATDVTRSAAGKRLAPDQKSRQAAWRTVLAHPKMIFDERQIQAVGRGFAKAVGEAHFRIVACAIMRNHVHAVVLRHSRRIEMVVGHLRSRATKQLGLEGLRPAQPIWGVGGWHRFLHSAAEIAQCVAYVNANPRKAGLPAQTWDFVTAWGGAAA